MVKQPKTGGEKEKTVVLERRYGPYMVKVCFAEHDSDTVQNLLDMIVQAYRYREEKSVR